MLKQTNINILHSGIVNKTRYDDSGKPMKQTNFTVKNLEGRILPKKQFTIVKRIFRFSTKLLFLDSTIPVNELTAETFYRFRTSKLFRNLLHESQYVTNQWCTDPNTWLTPTTWRRLLAANFFTSSTMKIKKYFVTKTLSHKNVVISCRENKILGYFSACVLHV